MQFSRACDLNVTPVKDIVVCGLKYNAGCLEKLSSDFLWLTLSFLA